MNDNPDAIIEVRFLPTNEGGREYPAGGFGYRACFEIGGSLHDGCFLRRNGYAVPPGPLLELGVSYEVPVVFLRPDLVLAKLAEELPITLREGHKIVATGRVVKVLRASP